MFQKKLNAAECRCWNAAEHMANLQGQPLTSIFVDPWITAVEPAVAAVNRRPYGAAWTWWHTMDLVAPPHMSVSLRSPWVQLLIRKVAEKMPGHMEIMEAAHRFLS